MKSRRPTTGGSELQRLQERLNRLLEQALLSAGGEVPQSVSSGWRPVLDLVETADSFILYAELPGVTREEIELDSDGRTLELSGERRPGGGERGYLRLEGSYGPFRRKLELPEPVDEERITARLRRGMLEVTMPKRVAKSGTTVPVREG